MNTVEALMETPFSTLSLADQLQIKEMGPHRPKLQIQEVTVDRGMQCTRKFSEDWYQKKEWLCGSTPKEALFCFPCLLFGGEKLWTQTGVKDLKDFPQKVNEHEASKRHTDNMMRLYILGKANIGAELDEEFCASIRRHNQEVDSNRYVLSRIIDCIRFCESLQKAPPVYDEEEQPHSSGVFRNLIEFVASYNDTTQQHWQQATVFRDLEKTIQSKLLDCMLTVARAHIKEELSSAAFVAMEVDDISDVSDDCQNVLIFRYMPKDEPPVERFYGVTQLKNPRAETVATALLQYLEELFPQDADKDKLIAQSYDGASEMPGEERGVQHRIRDAFHNAHYVHSDAHELTNVLQKAAGHVPGARMFFRDLFGCSEFFSNYEKGTELLEKVMRRRLPTDVLTGWNMMSLISEKRQGLIDCLEDIDDVLYYPLNVQRPAAISVLESKKFLYWLSFFLRIMPCIKDLDSQLQRRHMDPAAVNIGVRDFVNAITTVRGSIGTLIAELPPGTIVSHWKSKETMDQQAYKVCDIIISHIQERFAWNQHLSSARLLDPSLYPAHNQNFPEGTLDEVVKAYPMLDKNRLRTELSTIYAREELYTAKGALEVLQLLVKDNFPQLVMLLRIFITMPLNTPERQQSFSALKRVKSFLRSSVWEENINTSLMLSIEKEMLKSIPHFNLKVIEVFAAQKEHQAYFMYKK